MLRHYWRALNQMQRAFFACYLEEEVNQARIMRLHGILFHAVSKLRRQKQVNHEKMERLYEAILLLGQLRFRVRDRTIFDVCRDELTEMTRTLSDVLQSSKPEKRERALSEFDRAIAGFQDLYQGVLRVTARDPLVFQFLVGHLNAIRMEVIGFTGGGSLASTD